MEQQFFKAVEIFYNLSMSKIQELEPLKEGETAVSESISSEKILSLIRDKDDFWDKRASIRESAVQAFITGFWETAFKILQNEENKDEHTSLEIILSKLIPLIKKLPQEQLICIAIYKMLKDYSELLKEKRQVNMLSELLKQEDKELPEELREALKDNIQKIKENNILLKCDSKVSGMNDEEEELINNIFRNGI